MASKSLVVLLADAKEEWRDAKLCRFVRDAQENPVLTFVKWTHGAAPRWLAITGDRLCEVQRINDDRSLFAPGNIVVQDGSLLVVTPMDPLFVLLGQLATWSRNSQFCSIHDVMESSGLNLDAVSRWNPSSVASICDVEDAEDMDTIRIRCNEAKITEWLRRKVERIMRVEANSANKQQQQAFNDSFQRPPGEAQPAESVGSTQQTADDKHKALQHAIFMLTEYIDEKWTELLVKSYGMSPTDWQKEKSTEKAISNKPGDDMVSKFDVRQTAPSQKRAAPKATTPAPAKKKPIDTSGMKSIASFFGKK
ncbi:unnamed protein product [Aphanomyces euteiches]